MNYFAYGSNMNENRMTSRGVNFIKKEKGVLKGYKFTINKKSFKNPNIGFANVIKDEKSEVEGIIFELNHDEIYKLDAFEGFPKHYRREIHKINNKDCIVYIANDPWIVNETLSTTEEYKNHILKGKEYLSENYYNELLKIKTI